MQSQVSSFGRRVRRILMGLKSIRESGGMR